MICNHETIADLDIAIYEAELNSRRELANANDILADVSEIRKDYPEFIEKPYFRYLISSIEFKAKTLSLDAKGYLRNNQDAIDWMKAQD